MANTIVLITGANTGLGFETVKALCQSNKPYTILLGGRNLAKAQAAVETALPLRASASTQLQAVQIDIEDAASIVRLVDTVSNQYNCLDVLINNAGGQFDQQVPTGEMTMREVWDKSWGVNTTSTFMLTHAFVPLLLQSTDPRLLFITSGTSTLAEHNNTALAINTSPPKGWPKPTLFVPAYRSAKTGMNMMMLEWARLLKEDGVKMWCVSPGQLATGLGPGAEKNKQMGAIDPAIGAAFVKDVVEGKRDADVGKVIRRDNIQPW